MNKNKEMTDDEYANYETDIEKTVNKTVESIDKLTQEKEKEILTI